MANWKLIGSITGCVIIVGAIGNACGTSNDSSGTATDTSTSTASSGAKTSSSENKAENKAIPNFVGKGLQSAQDTAQAAGFYSLKSHDALGRARHQILDRDWKVCSQNIKADTKNPTTAGLDFGVVKLNETCPAKDQPAPSAAGAMMPNFKGKSVAAARAALDSGTSITTADASGDGRHILVESNWLVCSQTPAAGAKLNGHPVEFGAVKFGEACP